MQLQLRLGGRRDGGGARCEAEAVAVAVAVAVVSSCDEMTAKGDSLSLGGLRVWGTRSFAETELVPPVSIEPEGIGAAARACSLASKLAGASDQCPRSTALMAGDDWLELACAFRARILTGRLSLPQVRRPR